MNIQTLYSKLASATGSLVLNTSNIGAKAMGYLTFYLGKESLTINNPQIEPPDEEDRIRITGSAMLLDQAAFKATIYLTVSTQQKVEIEMTAQQVDVTWRLPSTFGGLNTGYFQNLNVQGTSISFDSKPFNPNAADNKEPAVAYVKTIRPVEKPHVDIEGLSWSLKASSATLLPWQTLFPAPNIQELEFTGNFFMFEGNPILKLSTTQKSSFTLGSATFDVGLQLVNYRDDLEIYRGGLLVTADTVIGGKDITLAAMLPASSGLVLISGSFEKLYLPTLSDLLSVVNDGASTDALPAALVPDIDVELRNITLGMMGKDLSYVSVVIGASDIQLIDGLDFTRLQDVSLRLNVNNPLDKQSRTIGAKVITSIQALGATLTFTGSLPSWDFHAVLTEGVISTSTLIDTFFSPYGLSWPKDIPSLDIDEFDLFIPGKSSSFYLALGASQSAPLSIGNLDVTLEDFALNISRIKKEKSVDYAIDIIANIYFNSVSLFLRGTKGETASAWAFNGITTFSPALSLIDALNDIMPGKFEIPDEILDIEVTSLALLADFNAKSFSFVFNASTELEFDGVCKFAVANVNIAYKKPEAKGQKASWDISLEGQLKLENALNIPGLGDTILNLKGAMNFTKDKTGWKFAVTPKEDTAKIPIPLPFPTGYSPNPKLTLTVQAFTFGKTKETNSPKGTYAFTTAVSIGLKNMPSVVDNILPDSIFGSLSINKQEAWVTIDKLVDKAKIPLGKMPFFNLDFGQLFISITGFKVFLGKESRLTFVLGLGLPPQLNYIFGKKKNGQPNLNFFKTVANKEEFDSNAALFRPTIKKKGIQLVIENSPITYIDSLGSGDGIKWQFGNKDYGKMSIELPTLTFDIFSRTIYTDGQVQILEPISIPLGPIGDLIDKLRSALGIPGKAATKIPIRDIKLAENGDVKLDKLVDYLSQAGNIPSEIESVLRQIDKYLDRLPPAFLDYLSFEVPRHIVFKLSMQGPQKIGFRLESKDKPFRILRPTVVPGIVPMPGFEGITLRTIGFGTLMSGSLFYIELDGYIDQFDIGTLATSMFLPQKASFPLPMSKELHRRILFEELFMLLVYQTGIPIPIPLFYDRIGIEYLGIEGLGLGMHFKFPQPTFSPETFTDIFESFGQFFTDPKYKLDPKSPPGGTNFVFTIEDTYLQLPEYLGSKSVGLKNKSKSIDTYALTANMLNAMKDFSINDLIQATPYSNRAGNADFKFAFLSFGITWLVCTPKEFYDKGYQTLSVGKNGRNTFLSILPALANGAVAQKKPNQEGLVVFLRGKAAIGKVVTLDAAFGLAAFDSVGFNTGFRFTGKIAKLLYIELKGLVAVAGQSNPNSPTADSGSAFLIHGSSLLKIAGKQIFKGIIEIRDNGFYFDGQFNVMSFKARITGSLDKNKFYLEGNATLNAGPIKLGYSKLIISNHLVSIEGKYLGVACHLSLGQFNKRVRNKKGRWVNKKFLKFTAGISVGFNLKVVFPTLKIKGVKVADGFTVGPARTAVSLSITISDAGFSATVSAEFFGIKLGKFTISVGPSDIKALGKVIEKEVLKVPEKFFNQLIGDAGKWLEMVGSGAIEWAEGAFEDMGKALNKVFGKAEKEVAQLMKGAGHLADEAGEAIKGFANDTKKVFNGLHKTFTSSEIGSALKANFPNISMDDTVKLFKDAGDDVEDAIKAVDKVFSNSAKDVGKALRNVGYESEKIANGLKNVMKAGANEVAEVFEDLGKDAVEGILKGANFTGNAIAGALKDVLNWIPHVKIPHVKHIKLPHVKHIKIPHVKHVKIPHVKHIKIPHVKHVKFW